MKASRIALTTALTALVAACGGGSSSGSNSGSGGGTTPTVAISGTAATGAAVTGSMNAVITIKDSSATPKLATTTTDASGKYSFTQAQVAGMSAPLMEELDYQVAGTHYYLHSAVTTADLTGGSATINITPFTDLIIANIAGDIASNVFKNNTFKTKLTPAAMTAGVAALDVILQPVLQSLGVSGTLDLLHQSFSADGTGLDKVLDTVKVTVDPGQGKAILTNSATSDTVTVDMTLPLSSTTTTLPAPPAGAVTDLQALQERFHSFFGVMNGTPVPTATDARLLAFFDQTHFLDDGQNMADFLQNIIDPTILGHLQFADVSLHALPTGVTIPSGVPVSQTCGAAPNCYYDVQFQVVQAGSKQDYHDFVVYKDATSGNWLVLGDLKKVKAQARVEVDRGFRSTTGTNSVQFTCSGLDFNIEDPGNLMVGGTVTPLSYAVITGPGLPAAGALYINAGGSQMRAAAGAPSTFSGPNTAQRTDCMNSSAYGLGDTDIGTIANAIATHGVINYTIQVFTNTSYAANAVPAVTYSAPLHVAPLSSTQISNDDFPTAITASPTLEAAAAASVVTNSTVSWTPPANTDLAVSELYFCVGVNTTGNSSSQCLGKNLSAGTTSSLVAVPKLNAVVSSIYSNVNLNYYDSQGRKYQFSPAPTSTTTGGGGASFTAATAYPYSGIYSNLAGNYDTSLSSCKTGVPADPTTFLPDFTKGTAASGLGFSIDVNGNLTFAGTTISNEAGSLNLSNNGDKQIVFTDFISGISLRTDTTAQSLTLHTSSTTTTGCVVGASTQALFKNIDPSTRLKKIFGNGLSLVCGSKSIRFTTEGLISVNGSTPAAFNFATENTSTFFPSPATYLEQRFVSDTGGVSKNFGLTIYMPVTLGPIPLVINANALTVTDASLGLACTPGA